MIYGAFSNDSKAQSTMSRSYVGIQAGVPLFWGDLFSFGDQTRLGHGLGIAIGRELIPWLDVELSLDYGISKLGPGDWQLEDYIDQQGTIRYTQGTVKLGELYSRTSFGRVGLRIPIKLLALLRPKTQHCLEIEMAPHFYLNHFRSELYHNATNLPILAGTKPDSPVYATGGDLGLSLRLAKGTAIYLRSALSYLSDERFEGISSTPAWNINLQLYNTIGIRMNLNQQ